MGGMDNTEQTQPTPNTESISVRGDGRRFRGYRFRIQRKERGLKLEDVAKHLKLSVSKISLFERGRQDLSIKALERLEKFLKMPAEEVKADAQVRSRDIEADTIRKMLESRKPLPWVSPTPITAEMVLAEDERMRRDYGSLANYLRINSELQAKEEKISGLQVQLWDANGQIQALKAENETLRRQGEKIRKASAFFGEF